MSFKPDNQMIPTNPFDRPNIDGLFDKPSLEKSEVARLRIKLDELQKELDSYHWRELKDKIVHELDLNVYHILDYNYTTKKSTVKDYLFEYLDTGRYLSFLKHLYKIEDVDRLLVNGIAYDDIIRAIKEFFLEVLDEHKKDEEEKDKEEKEKAEEPKVSVHAEEESKEKSE